MKKKFLSLCMIGAMLLTTLPLTAFASENDSTVDDANLPFGDVNVSDWYHDAVDYVYQEGLMTGTSDTTFEPNLSTTRAMIVSILYRLEGNPDLSTEDLGDPFEDVAGDAWFAAPVYWARLNGIVNGYSDSAFGPNDAITREQLAAILYNYTVFKGGDVSASTDLSAYSDAGQISSWATTVMSWANAEGLINGMTADTLEPQGTATRAQVAAILQRYLSDTSTPEEPSEGDTATLMIGLPDDMQRVEVTLDEVSPETVLAALAEETGWNLTLATPVQHNANGYAIVAFANNSGVYTEPPAEQKDEYHVYDVESWMYTVLNSVAETLQANGAVGVFFTAPNGDDMIIENGGVRLYLSNTFVWNYNIAYQTNHLPDDRLGFYALLGTGNSAVPQPASALGVPLTIICAADNATFDPDAVVTVYDENGDVYDTFTLGEENAITKVEDPLYGKLYNLDHATTYVSTILKNFTSGTYSVTLPDGAFSANGLSSKGIDQGQLTLNIGDYGIVSTTLPFVGEITLGTPYTMTIALDGTTADKAIFVYDEEYYDFSVDSIDETTTVTITPRKLISGPESYDVDFYIGYYKDGSYVADQGFTYNIVEPETDTPETDA